MRLKMTAPRGAKWQRLSSSMGAAERQDVVKRFALLTNQALHGERSLETQ